MSSDANSAAALASAVFTGNYCDVAASVLFIYEVFVTFDREVACYWSSKPTAASVLFLANKWVSVTVYIMTLISFATLSDERLVLHMAQSVYCSSFVMASIVIEAVQFIPWAAFSALRAFVLSKNKLVGLLILALSLTPVGVNLVRYGYDPTGQIVPPFGCLETDQTTQTISLKSTVMNSIVLISRIPLIVTDVLLIYITWTKLSTRDALRSIRPSKRLTFSDILFLDGTVYFVVLFIMNVLHLSFSLASVAIGFGQSYLTTFTAPITSILVSRFLLELQEANRTVVRVDLDDPLHSSRNPYETPSFITSIGAFISPDIPAARNDGHQSDLHVDSRSDLEEEGVADASQSQTTATYYAGDDDSELSSPA